MAGKTNRREFVQAAGLAASALMATARPSAGVVPEPQTRAAPRTMGARFRALLNGPEPLICPGAYDVLTARLIEAHGFKGAFVGSSVVNQALVGAPDQALVTVSEIIDYNCVIAANVDIPILADWPTATRAAFMAAAVAGKFAPPITAMSGFFTMSAAFT